MTRTASTTEQRSLQPLRALRLGLDRFLSLPWLPYVVVILICIPLLLPIYWTFVTSIKPTPEIFSWPPTLWPRDATLEHYVTTLAESPIPSNILNSAIYSLAVTAVVIVIGTLTTYGFSVFPYRGSNTIAMSFLAIRIIPPQILWLPFIILFTQLGLINSRPGVIIFEIVLVYPLSIWLLKGVFDAFPRDLLDAAAIDGASRLTTLLRVVVPVIAPGVGAVAIIAFLWTWNEFMFPFLVLNDQALYPITVGLHYFVGDEGIKWGPISASGVLAMLPGLVFFILAQRHIVEGLSEGAVKA